MQHQSKSEERKGARWPTKEGAASCTSYCHQDPPTPSPLACPQPPAPKPSMQCPSHQPVCSILAPGKVQGATGCFSQGADVCAGAGPLTRSGSQDLLSHKIPRIGPWQNKVRTGRSRFLHNDGSRVSKALRSLSRNALCACAAASAWSRFIQGGAGLSRLPTAYSWGF